MKSVCGLWAGSTVRCCSKGGPVTFPQFFPLLFSFRLPQDDINEAADEAQREGHPGQDIGVAKMCYGFLVGAHHGVYDRSTHHKHT